MKTILLLRHAKSSWSDPALDDFDRPLAKRGRLAAAAIARHLAADGRRPEQVLCSPARRTRETLEFLEGSFGAAVPVRFERGLYMAEAPTLLRRLRRLSDGLAAVMLIGHNPGLERLAAMLVAGSDTPARRRLDEKFPTGALAVLESDVDGWRDLGPDTARLATFIRPRDLEGG